MSFELRVRKDSPIAVGDSERLLLYLWRTKQWRRLLMYISSAMELDPRLNDDQTSAAAGGEDDE